MTQCMDYYKKQKQKKSKNRTKKRKKSTKVNETQRKKKPANNEGQGRFIYINTLYIILLALFESIESFTTQRFVYCFISKV